MSIHHQGIEIGPTCSAAAESLSPGEWRLATGLAFRGMLEETLQDLSEDGPCNGEAMLDSAAHFLCDDLPQYLVLAWLRHAANVISEQWPGPTSSREGQFQQFGWLGDALTQRKDRWGRYPMSFLRRLKESPSLRFAVWDYQLSEYYSDEQWNGSVAWWTGAILAEGILRLDGKVLDLARKEWMNSLSQWCLAPVVGRDPAFENLTGLDTSGDYHPDHLSGPSCDRMGIDPVRHLALVEATGELLSGDPFVDLEILHHYGLDD